MNNPLKLFSNGLLLVMVILRSDAQFSSTTTQHDTRVNIERHAYFDATSKWDKPNIFVCWENPSDQFTREMLLVQTAVQQSWEAVSAVRFTGWQKCATANAGIHIAILDSSGPLTQTLGRHLDGIPNGMILDFTFESWNPMNPNCKLAREFCIRAIAVHEFGHGLGFAHEQNRPDTPGECAQLKSGPDGTQLLTPYDPESVMNYCNPTYNNGGKLSATDAEAVKNIYGEKPAS